ncbi:hypothetical protein HK101_010871 [Irineochytrium annulatum]|nr:hypothetical protein HK101_010871 [Irineochytrium annulatum]
MTPVDTPSAAGSAGFGSALYLTARLSAALSVTFLASAIAARYLFYVSCLDGSTTMPRPFAEDAMVFGFMLELLSTTSGTMLFITPKSKVLISAKVDFFVFNYLQFVISVLIWLFVPSLTPTNFFFAVSIPLSLVVVLPATCTLAWDKDVSWGRNLIKVFLSNAFAMTLNQLVIKTVILLGLNFNLYDFYSVGLSGILSPTLHLGLLHVFSIIWSLGARGTPTCRAEEKRIHFGNYIMNFFLLCMWSLETQILIIRSRTLATFFISTTTSFAITVAQWTFSARQFKRRRAAALQVSPEDVAGMDATPNCLIKESLADPVASTNPDFASVINAAQHQLSEGDRTKVQILEISTGALEWRQSSELSRTSDVLKLRQFSDGIAGDTGGVRKSRQFSAISHGEVDVLKSRHLSELSREDSFALHSRQYSEARSSRDSLPGLSTNLQLPLQSHQDAARSSARLPVGKSVSSFAATSRRSNISVDSGSFLSGSPEPPHPDLKKKISTVMYDVLAENVADSGTLSSVRDLPPLPSTIDVEDPPAGVPEIPATEKFTPVDDVTYYGGTRIIQVTSEIVTRIGSFIVMLLFVSCPPNAAWSAYFNAVPVTELVGRFAVMLMMSLVGSFLFLWVEGKYLGVDWGGATRDVVEADVLGWCGVGVVTFIGLTPMMGAFLMADTGYFFGNGDYVDGRRVW